MATFLVSMAFSPVPAKAETGYFWTLESMVGIAHKNLCKLDPSGTVLERNMVTMSEPEGLAFQSVALTPIHVDIDVKPGDDPSTINPKSKGVIPVAILSTLTFDAPSMVDATSVKFGHSGTKASAIKAHTEDVNGDGLLDLVLFFRTQETGFQSGDTMGYLTGITTGGIPIEGADSVRVL